MRWGESIPNAACNAEEADRLTKDLLQRRMMSRRQPVRQIDHSLKGSNWHVKWALAPSLSPLRMRVNIAKPRLEKTVKTFIQSGTRFLVEVGTKTKPGLVR